MLESSAQSWLTGAWLALVPIGLLLAALPGVSATRTSALSARQRVRLGALWALFAVFAAGLSFAIGSHRSPEIDIPLPGLRFPFPLSVDVNGLTLALTTLVAFVVTMIAQYGVQYLDGDPQQARFFRLLGFTSGFFLVVVVAGNLGLFTLGIIATGFGLHRLLEFYSERPKAIMAAHKKSLFSRTADICLVGAAVLVGQTIGSLQFEAIRSFAEQSGVLPTSLQVAAWLIVFAVILKSAHFPFQGWLIQVMEAPTPVSALLHAGVIYSGAIVALRASPLLVRVPDVLIFLAAFGLLTAVVAALVMTTQTAVKSMLAWSTTAQLGFMSLEIGLGLFPLALLHLIGHSLYKAHAFLSSSSVTDQLRQVPPGGKKIASMGSWLVAVTLGVLISAGSAWAFGDSPLRDSTWIALVAIVAVAVSQILVKGLQFDAVADRLAAVIVAMAMGLTYLVLHTLFVLGFSQDTAVFAATGSAAYRDLVWATILGFLTLSWIQGPGQALLPERIRFVLFAHLYNGLYVDYRVDQFSHRFWSEKVGVELPRKNLAVESLESIARNQEVADDPELVKLTGGIR